MNLAFFLLVAFIFLFNFNDAFLIAVLIRFGFVLLVNFIGLRNVCFK